VNEDPGPRASRWLLREQIHHQGDDPFGTIGAEIPNGPGLFPDHGPDVGGEGGLGIEVAAGEELVGHHAESIEIRRWTTAFAAADLGRKISGRSQDPVAPGEHVLVRASGESEIDQLETSRPIYQDVIRLDVTVLDPLAMEVGESRSEL